MKGGATGVAAVALGSGPRSLPVAAQAQPGVGPITIFEARKIVTLDELRPEATHVAVRDGRILGTGSLEVLAGWRNYTLDDSFKDLVIVPGFIEAHNHVFEAFAAFYTYVGFFDRPAIDGSILKGIKSYDELITRLKEEEAKLKYPNEPLIAIGFDSIYFWGQDPFSRVHLDQVSTTRQVAIWTASEHSLLVNSAVLKANGITAETTTEGVVRDEAGEPAGILYDPLAMGLAASIHCPMIKKAVTPNASGRSGSSRSTPDAPW